MSDPTAQYESAIARLESVGFVRVLGGPQSKRLVELHNKPLKVRIILDSFEYRVQVGAENDPQWFGIDFVGEFLAPAKFEENKNFQTSLLIAIIPEMNELFSGQTFKSNKAKLEDFCSAKSAALLKRVLES